MCGGFHKKKRTISAEIITILFGLLLSSSRNQCAGGWASRERSYWKFKFARQCARFVVQHWVLSCCSQLFWASRAAMKTTPTSIANFSGAERSATANTWNTFVNFHMLASWKYFRFIHIFRRLFLAHATAAFAWKPQADSCEELRDIFRSSWLAKWFSAIKRPEVREHWRAGPARIFVQLHATPAVDTRGDHQLDGAELAVALH